jgi:hypothetical protein
MKKLFFLVLVSLYIFKANAQCNNPFFQIKEGTIIVMESFDKKDKLQSRNESRVIKYDGTVTGFTATISFKVQDNKDKVISEGEYDISCEDGVIKIDMSSFVPAQSMTAFQDMEVDVNMDQLEYPAQLSAGQALEDASIEIVTSNNPIPMKLLFDIIDRKVEGKESITTPAGTFECYKISYNTKSKVMIANMNFKNVEYLAENSGAVRTETYKSNGTLIGYTLLTKYEY